MLALEKLDLAPSLSYLLYGGEEDDPWERPHSVRTFAHTGDISKAISHPLGRRPASEQEICDHTAMTCPSPSATALLDLSPPVQCASARPWCHAGSNETNPACHVVGAPPVNNIASFLAVRDGAWPHGRQASGADVAAVARGASLADVGVGIPVAVAWARALANGSALGTGACAADDRSPELACAARTWMRGAGAALEVVLLATVISPDLPSSTISAPAPCSFGLDSEHQRARVRLSGIPGSRGQRMRSNRDGALATLHFFCYQQGPPVKRDQRVHKGLGGYIKTALLLQTMLGRMPAKLFYLKLDADAVLSPPGLARFVDALARRMHPASLYYFGSAFLRDDCTTVNDRCRAFTFNRGTVVGARGMRLRDTPQFRKLEAELRSSDEIAYFGNRSSVLYAMGGCYGFSRPALNRLVASDGIRRVGKLQCTPRKCKHRGFAKHLGMHHHEDANVGLSAHINGITLLHHPCFAMGGQLPSFRSVPKSAAELTRMVCEEPIAIHPAKRSDRYLRWWHALTTLTRA